MKCANPICRTEALYLRSGTLHSIDCIEGENRAIRRRIIWLCDICNQQFTVEPWRSPGEQLQHRPKPALPSPAPAAEMHSSRRLSLGTR